MEAGDIKGIPWEHVRRDLEERYGPFDEEEHEKQIEAERVGKERIHNEAFVGTPTLEELINKIYSGYREYVERDRTENRWRHPTENAQPVVPPDR